MLKAEPLNKANAALYFCRRDLPLEQLALRRAARPRGYVQKFKISCEK
jgi:hypothetical protein